MRNRWLLDGLVLAKALQFAVIYTAPMIRIFHTVPISLASFFLIAAAALPSTAIRTRHCRLQLPSFSF